MDKNTQEPKYSRKWLIISHAFNMDGRAASQTITDKIPFLMQLGIAPIVVSAQTGTKDTVVEHHQVPAIAPSGLKFDMRHILKKHIRNPLAFKMVKFFVSLVLLPFYLLERTFIHLESQWSWFIMAYVKGAALIKKHHPAILYSTGGANSAHFAGYLLAKRFRIPWIAELHDPMIHDHWRGSRMAYKWAAYVENRICHQADVAWWFTEGALKHVKERNPILGERGHMIIPGVQEPNFQDAIYKPRPKIHFGHFGSLAETRNLAVFIEALHGLLKECPKYNSLIQVDVYGAQLDPVSQKALQDFPVPGVFVEHGRLESDVVSGKSGRQLVLEAMRQSDVLILLHGNDPFCEEYIPSKLFEYLWTKRPILGLVWRNKQLECILEERGHIAVNALDASQTKLHLHNLVQQWENHMLLDSEKSNPFKVQDAVSHLVELVDNISRSC